MPKERANIAVILGTRPEAIKLAPIIRSMRMASDVNCTVCVTAQHRQMLDQALDVFSLRADTDLNLMTADQTLGAFTARAISALDGYLAAERPDLVVLQGDTTTVFCAALAAFYQGIPVAHVEAGLRTWDLKAPWPEEANRVLTSRLASLHLAPTEASRVNLVREGIRPESITVTGNPVVDALFLAMELIDENPPIVPGLAPEILAEPAKRIVLVTAHRRESFGQGFEDICVAIGQLADLFPSTHFVYPVHLNPRVREPVTAILNRDRRKNIHLIEPLSYLPFVRVMRSARLFLTDSGGIQEEALSLRKPVLVMRDATERPEGVECGAVRLVGTRISTIVSEVSRLLTDDAAYDSMLCTQNPYGDGHAASRIVTACRNFLALAQ